MLLYTGKVYTVHCREHNIKSYKSIQKKVFKLMVVASKQTNQKAKALSSRPMASKPKLPSVSPGSFITDVTPCSTLTSLLSSQVELNRIFIIFQPNGTLQFQNISAHKKVYFVYVFSFIRRSSTIRLSCFMHFLQL